ncbi:MAG: zinc ribbon domain-containing protein [Anaerolineales bacterium]|nr:zinc ribbon domain-containing protein [Anaerolineales bacterium]
MAKKKLGYVKLEWTCPNCETRNPGPNAFCNGCGAPQPEDVVFEQPPEEKLITDAAELERAKAGPDKHCPFCQARNPGNVAFCGACGGDLSGAAAREHGRVLGAHRDQVAAPILCPSCGTENPGTAKTCQSCGASLTLPKPEAKPAAPPRKIGGLAVILIAVACVASILGIILLTGGSDTIEGEVVGVYWERSIAIEMVALTQSRAFLEDIPSGAEIGTCDLEYHHTQDQPADNSREVCGTPYTIDEGSGYGEVVQDCSYEVYQEYCEYEYYDWQIADTVVLTGTDLFPMWPSLRLTDEQREGTLTERYEVTFSTSEGTLEYAPETEAVFRRFEPGSMWELELNTFDRIVSAEPLR